MQDYQVLDGDQQRDADRDRSRTRLHQQVLRHVRGLYEEEKRSEMEAEYAEVIYGEPPDMIRFCLSRAHQHLGSGAPPEAVSPANYKIAARWYAMAGRFAQEAARSRDEDIEAGEKP